MTQHAPLSHNTCRFCKKTSAAVDHQLTDDSGFVYAHAHEKCLKFEVLKTRVGCVVLALSLFIFWGMVAYFLIRAQQGL